MIYRVSPKYGKQNPLIYISICSTVGSVSVMSIKAFGIALKLTLRGFNQFTHPSTYVFIIVVVVCILTQMNYFNKALSQFSTNMLVSHGNLDAMYKLTSNPPASTLYTTSHLPLPPFAPLLSCLADSTPPTPSTQSRFYAASSLSSPESTCSTCHVKTPTVMSCYLNITTMASLPILLPVCRRATACNCVVASKQIPQMDPQDAAAATGTTSSTTTTARTVDTGHRAPLASTILQARATTTPIDPTASARALKCMSSRNLRMAICRTTGPHSRPG